MIKLILKDRYKYGFGDIRVFKINLIKVLSYDGF